MRANELMVGNIVRYDGMTVYIGQVNNTKVEGMIDKNDLLIDIRFRVELLEPIPITEELLQKNGFERYDKHSFHLRVKPGYTLYLVKPKDSQPWYCKVYGIGPDDNYSINALYLHQYQNLCNIAGVEMKWMV